MAEFVEIMTLINRICESHKVCISCPIENGCSRFAGSENPKELENLVMAWAKEHPVQTNADKFKEVFGDNARKSSFYEEWWKKEYKAPTEGE